MKLHNVTGLRESLEQLQKDELQTMLQSELEREIPDPEAVRLILSILEDRETEPPPKLIRQREAAWQRYRKKVAALRKKPVLRWNVLVKAASVVLLAGLLFTVLPRQAQAETFWEMLQRWSSNLLEIVNPREHISSLDYVFKSDHEGLQQVYDAVVELRVTDPVVPMWLPEEYELVELESQSTPVRKGIWAVFACDNYEIIYQMAVFHSEPAHQYYKDDIHYETYEREGATYNITRNNDRWVVVWTKDQIECSIFVDCQEDTLRRILSSIYELEDS